MEALELVVHCIAARRARTQILVFLTRLHLTKMIMSMNEELRLAHVHEVQAANAAKEFNPQRVNFYTCKATKHLDRHDVVLKLANSMLLEGFNASLHNLPHEPPDVLMLQWLFQITREKGPLSTTVHENGSDTTTWNGRPDVECYRTGHSNCASPLSRAWELTACTKRPRACKQQSWNKAAAHVNCSIYTRCTEPPVRRAAHCLLVGMDRVLQCRSQIKTRQLATTRDSVTASVCLSAPTPLRATPSCQRTGRGAPDREKKEKFIDTMYYVPSPDDVLINRLVASATAKTEIVDTGEEKSVRFSHVEVSFPCDEHNNYFENDKTMGFSIVQNSTVHFRLKSWRDEYVAIRIYIDAIIYDKLYKTYALLALQNIKFDRFATYAAVLLPVDVLQRRTRIEHGTYCSEIITEVLQQCEIGGPLLASAVACQSTPNMLYLYLGGHKSAQVVRRPCERGIPGG